MLSPIPLSLALLLSTSGVLGAPRPSTPSVQTINMQRRSSKKSPEAMAQWAKDHRDYLTTKYGGSLKSKRSSGTNLLVNQDADSSYFGSIAIGTPPVSYDVILDTGSADLWVAAQDCTSCGNVATFNPSSSSTFKNESKPFQIQYGTGDAAGSLGSDTVQMAGFSVPNQVFAVCDQVSSGLLDTPVSGLMGLAWNTIASSGATPFWQTLAGSNVWDSPLMAFHLTRYLDDQNANALEPGGSFTMGATNSSLFTGSIDYQDIPSGQESYWILPLTGMTVQGNSVTLPTGSSSYSAIDTGTTLVGGPSDAIAAIFAQIPGSAPGTGQYEGYYSYPCSTSVNVSMSFGGPFWSVNPEDFQLTQISSSQCIGAFFTLTSGTSAPSWIVGDTFLKNVYSVFRYNPPSVGFATLSSIATAQNGAVGTAPTPTIGSVIAVSATSSSQQTPNAASMPARRVGAVAAGVAAVVFGACVL